MNRSQRGVTGGNTGVRVTAVFAVAVTLLAAGATATASAGETAVAGSAYPRYFTPPSRPAIPADTPAAPGVSPQVAPALQPFVLSSVAVVDPVVSNTVPNYSSGGGTEPSIALDPANPNDIVMTSFSGSWNASPITNAPMWFSADGGSTWTQEFTIPPPSGRAVEASGCPCDQTVDYSRNGTLYGSFLTVSPQNVISGDSANPTSSASWQWNGNPAQFTNNAHLNSADQPWLLVNRDHTTASQDDVWSGYVDLSTTPWNTQVAVSNNAAPPNFTVDNGPGADSGEPTDPGLRLAKDPRNGWMYALWQTSSGKSCSFPTTLHVNRSTDGGATWTLNGSSTGLALPAGQQDDGVECKFGGVNALIGGVDHLTVDPTNGDVYVVYGNDNANNGAGNQLLISRLTDNGSGGLNIGAAVTVSNASSTGLPSVAVTSDGTVGVLYDTFDGNASESPHFPEFTAHFARSTDHGQTFADSTLETFLSPELENTAEPRQRVLGDYQQLKAEGSIFSGVFSGNRAPFGSSTSVIDPIFFSTIRSTKTTYTGATAGEYNDTVKLSGTLADTGSGLGIPNKELTLRVGTESCTETTDSSGMASCEVTPKDTPGPYTASASFAGDSVHAASSGSAAFTLNQEESHLTYTGETTADYHDTFTASATLIDPEDGLPVEGKTITFTLGSGDKCTETTDNSGKASCSITPTQAAGSYMVTASFGPDTDYLSTSDSKPFTITKEETSTEYTGPTVILQGASGVTLQGKLLEDGTTPIQGRTLTLSLGGQHCVTGTTDASGIASCSLTFTGPLGSEPLVASFAGDQFYLPSSDASKTALVFAFPSRGTFVLGDVTAAAPFPSISLEFWGADWSIENVLSGGLTPPAFKGFAGTVQLPTSTPPALCAGPWTTSPGNSPPPPPAVPSYMGVLVSSSLTSSGNTISGNTAHIVVVKTEPGYASDPGHPGMGTVVASYC
jgi:hypothetical protein